MSFGGYLDVGRILTHLSSGWPNPAGLCGFTSFTWRVWYCRLSADARTKVTVALGGVVVSRAPVRLDLVLWRENTMGFGGI